MRKYIIGTIIFIMGGAAIFGVQANAKKEYSAKIDKIEVSEIELIDLKTAEQRLLVLKKDLEESVSHCTATQVEIQTEIDSLEPALNKIKTKE